ncbi:type II toxin-antitoxin system VapC family toxin [Thiocapsa bogorovii]|uniref:type II toxin-antitoxin system VapC family toxin n=1 Tax=Thiocapsa bogorovii TaxID=521689 RepID=UPI001E5A46E8|nr:type II toxin-antitoxin system VapC family toxin [Thiocapsa bogorovii]UHD15227.1 type II toxin-antitoxin system VapC family toxin [Thiocapsa bogorovii]
MRRALIDTNIYSLAMRGEPDVVDRLQQLDDLAFSVVSLGELLAGFRAGHREAKNRQELGRFLDSPRVRLLTVDEETADFYAAIVAALKRAGTPIPTNDIWIAAVAQRHGLPVYTRDAHFQAVPGLLLIP